MTFEEWWKSAVCKNELDCKKCKLLELNCSAMKKICRESWEESRKGLKNIVLKKVELELSE